jgi:protein ImuB
VVGCLRLTGWTDVVDAPEAALLDVAQQYSPRVTWAGPRTLLADLQGLERLFGDPRTLGESLRGSLADRGLQVHVALAPTCTTARLVAAARAGLSIVRPAEQAATLAALPIDLLKTLTTPPSANDATPSDRPPARFYRTSPVSDILRARRRARTAVDDRGALDGITPERLETFRRWGLRTLGDLAALPAADLAARLGPDGPRLQALARGEDAGPLVPLVPEERFETTLALEWPIDGLEPLSFVLGRLADPLAAHLDRRGRAASVLHVDLRLVTREVWQRRLELPSPIKDARTLRTLALLDLESHPPPAAVDAVTLRVDPTPAPTLQHSLLERARPAPEEVSTLVARLSALMGERRVGSPVLLDSHRPDAFQMTAFAPSSAPPSAPMPSSPSSPSSPPLPLSPQALLRRFRPHVVATVTAENGRPTRVRVSRPDLPGGRVETSAGPWRSAGEWWTTTAWDHDEWDVALDDGTICRLSRDRRKDCWYLDGVYD